MLYVLRASKHMPSIKEVWAACVVFNIACGLCCVHMYIACMYEMSVVVWCCVVCCVVFTV